MSKTSKIEVAEISVNDLEEIENSARIACDFIHDELLPLLDKFETENDDENYLQGMATHGLFAELVQRMGQLGYTEKDLRKEIKTYLNTSIGHTVH